MTDDQARQALEAERRRLQDVAEGIREGGDVDDGGGAGIAELSVLDQHPADVASETLDKEVDLALLEQVRSDLDDVERALARLEEGSYGLCEACGQPIGDDRLAAMPAARYCVAHQRAAEAEGHPAGRLSAEGPGAR